jgi:hypothetical protein
MSFILMSSRHMCTTLQTLFTLSSVAVCGYGRWRGRWYFKWVVLPTSWQTGNTSMPAAINRQHLITNKLHTPVLGGIILEIKVRGIWENTVILSTGDVCYPSMYIIKSLKICLYCQQSRYFVTFLAKTNAVKGNTSKTYL